MFTKLDKAIAAVILAVLVLATTISGHDFTVYAVPVSAALIALIPFAVYFVPNLEALDDNGPYTQLEQAATTVAQDVKTK